MEKVYLRLYIFAALVVVSTLVGHMSIVRAESPAAGAAEEEVAVVESSAGAAEEKVEAAEPSAMEFPDGYKDWPNTFAKVVSEEGPFHGFLRVLVSPEALAAYKNGSKGYKDGDVLILEFNEIENEADGPVKGEVNWIAVMVKDSTSTVTGGWRYAAFDGKTKGLKADVDPVTGCYNCHKAMEHRDYIFSESR